MTAQTTTTPIKSCITCRVEKPLIDFHRDKNNKSGLRNKCKKCAGAYGLEYKRAARRDPNKWGADIAPMIRRRARDRGIAFTITGEDLIVPPLCPIRRVPFVFGSVMHDNSPSVDRINPALGYVPGNVAVISLLANQIKSNCTDPNVFYDLCLWLAEQQAAVGVKSQALLSAPTTQPSPTSPPMPNNRAIIKRKKARAIIAPSMAVHTEPVQLQLPDGEFSCILADPPWSYAVFSKKGEARSASQHYDTMTLDDIKAMPVASRAAKNAHLFLWATAPNLPQALEVMAAWGFKYSAVAFVWVKLNKNADRNQLRMMPLIGDECFVGMGHTTRQNAEFVLLGRRGSPKRLSKAVRQIIVSPRREHSRKPDEAHARIETYCAGPRLELFARQSRPEWTTWGNQAQKFDAKPAPKPRVRRPRDPDGLPTIDLEDYLATLPPERPTPTERVRAEKAARKGRAR